MSQPLNPQGYNYGKDPANSNPFWGEGEQEIVSISATADVDDTTGTPEVTVENTGTRLNPVFKFEFSGLKGEPGAAGATGPQGPQGPQGIQGIQGEQGLQGIQGERGPAGATGATGETGPQGPQGERGLQGETGPQGPQGERGLQGIQGPQGEQGPRGLAGANGQDGVTPAITIAAEVTNTTGTPSASVSQTGTLEAPTYTITFSGLKGETGATGPEGPAGGTGATGPQGPAGATPVISATASVTSAGATGVNVTKTGSDAAPNFNFAFTGIGGGGGGGTGNEANRVDIAPEFNTTTNYSKDDLVYYNDGNGYQLYQFTADHTAGAWIGTDTTVVDVAAILDQLKASFEDGVDDIYDACVAMGATPASHSIADCVTAILSISGGGFVSPVATDIGKNNTPLTTQVGIGFGKYYALIPRRGSSPSMSDGTNTKVTEVLRTYIGGYNDHGVVYQVEKINPSQIGGTTNTNVSDEMFIPVDKFVDVSQATAVTGTDSFTYTGTKPLLCLLHLITSTNYPSTIFDGITGGEAKRLGWNMNSQGFENVELWVFIPSGSSMTVNLRTHVDAQSNVNHPYYCYKEIG